MTAVTQVKVRLRVWHRTINTYTVEQCVIIINYKSNKNTKFILLVDIQHTYKHNTYRNIFGDSYL